MSGPAQILQQERLTYPGLLPREIILLRNWLKRHEAEYDRFDYNFRVGAGVDPGANYPTYIREMAILNTRKRIDAIGWKGSQATIIEVKDRAGFSALGQILGYRPLFRLAFPGVPEPKLLIVTNRLNNDIQHSLTEYNVTLELVEADYSILRSRAPAPGQ